MAQTLQQQDSRESSSNSENKPPAANNSGNQQQQQVQQSNQTAIHSGAKIATRATAARIAPPVAADSPAPVPTTNIPSPTLNSEATPIFNRHQPSKIFITKCRTELESLLNSIKDKYHEEIKALNTDIKATAYADFFIQIGEEFKKPSHKCIIASRAFKLYNTLRAFELVEVPVEEDIIISEFQDKRGSNRDTESEEESGGGDTTKSRPETPNTGDPSKSTPEPITTLHCHLPDNLISPELLLNFIRRVYLDQDISEEETKFHQTLIDWLKLNKPELIKKSKSNNNKHSPDHRASFRTVQPFFEETTPSKTPPAKSPTMSTDQNEEIESNIESNIDEMDETSQATSAKDESLTSSLTRTETFELISRKDKPESPSAAAVVATTPNRNRPIESDYSNDDNEDEDRLDVSSDISNTNSSNTPTPYAPTTRTGLKPKTFTTPVNMRPTPRTTTTTTTGSSSKTTTSASKSSARDESSKTKISSSPAPAGKVVANNKLQTPTAAKRSSLSSNQSTESATTTPDAAQGPKLTGAVGGKTLNKSQAAAVVGSTKNNKLTSIVRAHPISLERSQSPNTNVMNKGSGRNFIAANKRLVSQMEKKTAQTNNDSSIYDSEAENSVDNYSYGLEPLTSDNLIAQMDKFTLVSHSKLADALSRLFIDGVMSDTVICAKDDRELNAHKCILAARSAYLAELIDKHCNLPEQQQQQQQQLDNNEKKTQRLRIDMREFSYQALYFSMMHIYTGIVKVPDDLDLEELTKLTNQLHVTTLRQVCIHNLRMNYCHYFHKPCNVCCVGVLKTLPLAWRYDYTELYSKCLQWIGSHFAQIFCLKEFSELKPHDLVEECYSATLSQLTPDNIIPKTIECQKLLKNLPRVKWTESIICLVGRQLQDFCHYVADNYEKILKSESFLNLGKNCWECEVLEENLLAAMNHLKPDSGCKTLIQLHKIECSIESYGEDPRNVSDSFANLVSKMRKYCERYLLKEAAAVVHCSSWRHMNPSLQKRIKDQAIISSDFDEPTKQLAAKPKLLTSSARNNQQQQLSTSPSQSLNNNNNINNNNSSEGARSPSNRSTPESRLKSPSTTYLPPPKSKTAAARHVKVLK